MAFFPIQVLDPLVNLEKSLRQLQQVSDLVGPLANPAQALSGYYRPWRHVAGQHSGTSNMHYDKEGFQIELDVQQFAPNEISVKTVENNVIVEAKHEEKEDEHGFVYRHFVRRYIIPKGVDPETITSTLSSDGLLTISAPPAKPLPASAERSVPIESTGVPARKEISEK